MKRLLSLLAGTMVTACALAAGPTPVFAGDPAKGQQIVAAVCSACHNADGNSTLESNPKLAGQHAEYLLKQMKNFKSEEGKPPGRFNPIMNAMISVYSEEQMHDIAVFLSSQKRKGEVAKNPDTIEFGRKIYRAGDPSKGLPACASCHGPTGMGIPPRFPRISGQIADYTDGELKVFRVGKRTNDPNRMMRMVTSKMTNAEIAAVSDYVAGLR